MIGLAPPRPRRRPGLTPLIDVVFLLLVFFMLASRFGVEGALPLAASGGTGAWEGPPRLVTVRAGDVLVNGVPAPDPAAALAPLMPDGGGPVVLRSEGADLQRLVDAMTDLRAAGLTDLVLVP